MTSGRGREPVIETRDLTRHYGHTVGIDGLDLAVEGGEVFGFLGPNGAGKTTTIRLLLDLIRPTRGSARVLGHPSSDASVRARIGHVPGELFLDGRMTGEAFLEFMAGLGGQESGAQRRRPDLCHRLAMVEADLKRTIREYSRGMKQKLALIAAFQHQPDLLVLDEPTTALDPLVREGVFALMEEAAARGATVFHSSHVLSEVERTCDRVAVLRQGRLAALMAIEEVRRKSMRRMVIDFTEVVPPELLLGTGVTLLEARGRRVVLRVTGDPTPLVRRLAAHTIEHLVFAESTLEEAFAALYQEGGAEP